MTKRKIYIIYTGGTIGMGKTPQGYQPVSGLLHKHMQRMPEFEHPDMPDYDLHEYPSLIDSSNITPKDWQIIGQDILKHYHKYDAFLVLHGTDTMAYTASALSFMLEGLDKPVILTGSQVPLIEAHTDARENLINAMLIAANYGLREVCIFFNNILLRGNRARKVNAYGFGAFISPNYPVLGEVGVGIDIKSALLWQPKASRSLSLAATKPLRLAKLTFFPGMNWDLLAAMLEQPLDALILESYGVGNAPTQQARLLKLLDTAVQQGVLVVNSTQCLRGSVDMGSYATGSALSQLGIASCYDMTPEAIITKLYYLLSQESVTTTTRLQQFEHNLRGELTPSK